MRSGSAPDPAPWIALAALGLAAAVLALIGLGDLPLRDFDEATVARVALEPVSYTHLTLPTKA